MLFIDPARPDLDPPIEGSITLVTLRAEEGG